MTDETVFETEATASRADVASLLSLLGDGLRDDSQITLTRDGETTTLAVPSELSVSIEVETGAEETEVEIELEWSGDPDVDADAATDAPAVDDALSPDETEAPRASMGRFEVYRDVADEWRWRLVHRNGNIIATGGEGYTSRQNAEKGLRSVMQNAPGADVSTER